MDAESGTPSGGEASSPYNVRPAPDLVAVLLGNATLLGIGYMFLRRWRLALLALAGTVTLVIALGATLGSAVVLVLLVVWWTAMVAHGWWLVRGTRSTARRASTGTDTAVVMQDGSAGTRVWTQRVVAGAVVVALAATVVGLRADAARTVHDAADAHTAGDCERSTDLLGGLDAADRVVYPQMVVDGTADLEACGLLLDALALGEQEPPAPLDAAAAVETYLEHPEALWDGAGPRRAEFLLDAAYDSGRVDRGALTAGFEQLATTLEATPDEAGQVTSVVETFLADLAEDPDDCATREVVEWVDGKDWTAPALAEPVAAASGEVPKRILGCARTLAAADELTESRHTYEAFLHDFRDDPRADAASDELYDVITGIQRKRVRDLLTAHRYCANPEPYRAAAPYRRSGGNPMRVYGIHPEAHEFPRSWLASSLDDMVLVACVDGPKQGSYQDTCLYESDASPWGSDVRFYASRFDVKLYEVRTGRQVAALSDEFGEPCPPSILVESFIDDFFVPPETKRSSFTSTELREMFDPYQT